MTNYFLDNKHMFHKELLNRTEDIRNDTEYNTYYNNYFLRRKLYVHEIKLFTLGAIISLIFYFCNPMLSIMMMFGYCCIMIFLIILLKNVPEKHPFCYRIRKNGKFWTIW